MEPIVIGRQACTLSIDTEVPCGVMQWHGYATSADMRQASERLGELIRERGLNRVLVDTTDLPILATEDQDFLSREWLPEAISKGLRAAALVSSRHYFARVGVESVNQRLAPGELTLNYFTHPGPAREWLRDLTVE